MNYYGLYLNPMTGRCEEKHCIAVSFDRTRLVDLLESSRVERYQEGNWSKSFRKGSRLEWYNPPEDCGQDYGILDLGTRERYLETHLQKWDSYINEYSIDAM